MAERYLVVRNEDPDKVVNQLAKLKDQGWETIVVPTPIGYGNFVVWYAVLLNYHAEEGE